MNLNDGTGYLRKRKKKIDAAAEPKDSSKSESLDKGVKLAIETDPLQDFRNGVRSLVAAENFDPNELSIRNLPNLEFDALVNGEPVRLRLSQERSRAGRRGRSSGGAIGEQDDTKHIFNGELAVVGGNPRDLSVRSFVLRLHKAHGYGIQNNSRWYWAIAVDLMFASMCFWGISGLVMWWQIKRTRRLGFVLLAASGIVATWLAIGMHWQLVHG